jgi:hypothetical protein
VGRKFLENKGFGDRSIEIHKREMPTEILKNRKFNPMMVNRKNIVFVRDRKGLDE